MAIKFKEIRRFLARNTRLSICFLDGQYHNYLLVSDIPASEYDELYVYGIGITDVEFSLDIYSEPDEISGKVNISGMNFTIQPALEIVLHDKPRDIERNICDNLTFKDLKPYLQVIGEFNIVNKLDWSDESYKCRENIPEKYDNMYVYGIGMEDNTDLEETYRELKYDTHLNKRMVLVLSDNPRQN
ncbi:MAG TPA: hypothetical protein DE316_07120 [Eubacterium sp.]|nr:hypothetical protein [Eubacterium sp.]